MLRRFWHSIIATPTITTKNMGTFWIAFKKLVAWRFFNLTDQLTYE